MNLIIRIRKWVSHCARKVRYGHMETAVLACERMKRKGVKGLTAYYCTECTGFHIGHKSPWQEEDSE